MFCSPRLAAVTIVICTLTADTAVHAKLTASSCLAQKRTAWSNLRKCQGTEEAKQLRGKMGDLAKCQTKLQDKLVKIDAKATKAGIGCRYKDNGDSTVTDFDTGLMWEKKNIDNLNDVFPWTVALKDFPEGYNTCVSSNGSTLGPCTSLYHDWRLPNIVELQSIVDLGATGCGSGSLCIDPIFGPTVANGYWSATTNTAYPDLAWDVLFSTGLVGHDPKGSAGSVRAVRAGL